MKPDRGGEGETKLPLGVIEGPIKKKNGLWSWEGLVLLQGHRGDHLTSHRQVELPRNDLLS